jgi:hypothetical protein
MAPISSNAQDSDDPIASSASASLLDTSDETALNMKSTHRIPDLSSIELPKTYGFEDDVDDKKADWGRQLWRLLRAKLEFDRPRLLRDSDESEFVVPVLSIHAASVAYERLGVG